MTATRVVSTVDAGKLRLDDILFRTEEPERTRLLRLWVEADHLGDGRVLLKPASGKTLVVRFKGQELVFNPNGRRVPRQMAIYLLLNFGENGIYRGRDQATGLTRNQWLLLSEDEKKRFDQSKLFFLDDYLTHVVDEAGAEEEKPSRKG